MKQHQILTASLVALSVSLGAPALAQMKTSKPASPDAATPSVQVSPATPSVEPVVSGPEEPRAPLGLKVYGAFDFLGNVNSGGFVPATTQAGGTTAPALAQASPSIPASGFSLGAEYELAALAVGARYQTFSFTSPVTASINPTQGITQTTAANFDVFLPQNYWELYGRLGALKLGYRNENYAGTGFGGSYGNLMAGLNFGLGIDPVALNVGVSGGYNLSKPSTVAPNIMHLPAEGDANLTVKFDLPQIGMLKAKVGYKAMAVANADAGSLLTVLTNPSSLLTPGAGQDTINALYATRYGLYTGPYAGVEFGF